jgi:hypothetical protein
MPPIDAINEAAIMMSLRGIFEKPDGGLAENGRSPRP